MTSGRPLCGACVVDGAGVEPASRIVAPVSSRTRKTITVRANPQCEQADAPAPLCSAVELPIRVWAAGAARCYSRSIPRIVFQTGQLS